jgi:hypothetical protein
MVLGRVDDDFGLVKDWTLSDLAERITSDRQQVT